VTKDYSMGPLSCEQSSKRRFWIQQDSETMLDTPLYSASVLDRDKVGWCFRGPWDEVVSKKYTISKGG